MSGRRRPGGGGVPTAVRTGERSAGFLPWIIVAVLAGGLYFLGTRLGWLDDLEVRYAQWRHKGSTRLAVIPKGGAIDLETGAPGVSERADVQWVMTPGGVPYLVPLRGALLAPMRGANWDAVDTSALRRQNYSEIRLPAGGPNIVVRPGALVAVRTVEGNLAKFRVVKIHANDDLRAEWLLYEEAPPGRQATRRAAESNPSIAWRQRLDEARRAYRRRHFHEMQQSCEAAIAEAEKVAPRDPRIAAALLGCGGLPEFQRHAPAQAEAWLRRAVALAEGMDHESIVAALGPSDAFLKERVHRALGMLYRDRRRPQEAARQFERAAQAVRAMPSPTSERHFIAVGLDLYELGVAHYRSRNTAAARTAFAEAKQMLQRSNPRHPVLTEIARYEERIDSLPR